MYLARGSILGRKTAVILHRRVLRGKLIIGEPEVPVVIDGNNLLYAARRVAESDVLIGRSMLCDTVAKWAQRRRERVTVVFDGPAPPAALAAQIGNPAITVSYSGAGVSADAALVQRLAADSAARRLLLVTSDRELVRAAKSRRARTMRSEEFWQLVQHDLARPSRGPREPREKHTGLEPGAADEWLDEFGLG
jgi:predicted RNA-binding protein with PIN domain